MENYIKANETIKVTLEQLESSVNEYKHYDGVIL